MRTVNNFLLAGALLAGMTVAAAAQPYYPPWFGAFGNPGYAPPAAPPAWSYDPYTSGLSPCPQWRAGNSERCAQTMPPTAGQPNFWTHR